MKTPKTSKIKFEMHPRIFSALGNELVTNDFVAITELVKNSYDAFASRVDIRFKNDPKTKEQTIEIEDNGSGMSLEIIEKVWAIVATPFREKNPYSKVGKKVRRVSGEKGLGRLSAARLGSKLSVITKTKKDSTWMFTVDWEKIIKSTKLETCSIQIEKHPEKYFSNTGTVLIISKLNKEWMAGDFEELKERVSKFISPFNDKKDFSIWLTVPGEDSRPLEVQPFEFLYHPPYIIKGKFTSKQTLVYKYIYDNGKDKVVKEETIPIFPKRRHENDTHDKFKCGSFEFEIRVWDLEPESLNDISNRFNLRKKREKFKE